MLDISKVTDSAVNMYAPLNDVLIDHLTSVTLLQLVQQVSAQGQLQNKFFSGEYQFNILFYNDISIWYYYLMTRLWLCFEGRVYRYNFSSIVPPSQIHIAITSKNNHSPVTSVLHRREFENYQIVRELCYIRIFVCYSSIPIPWSVTISIVYVTMSLNIPNTIQSWASMVRLCITWWRHQMETFSALLVICAGNSPVTGEFPAQRPVTRSFDVFFDLRLNERLSKQSRGCWFETPLRPLWRHGNDLIVCVNWSAFAG